MQKYLKADEVADILRTSVFRVTEACREGKLRAYKPGRHWLIEPQAVEDYVAAHQNVPAAPTPTGTGRRRNRRTRAA